MTRKQQRICAIGLILLGAAVAAGLALFALRDTVTFFYTPSDLKGAHAKFIAPDRPFRLGGLVEKGSLKREGSVIHFTVTDTIESIDVSYDGVPPDLFRENSGVVANGKLNPDGTFTATQLLARHDENYMPPEVAKAMKNIPRTNSP
jgi:cytochrome c-type biogenesis protein CcmE